MRILLSRIFYFLSLAGFAYCLYNAANAVNMIFQKSSETEGPIYQGSKEFIYISALSFFAGFAFYIIGRKISKVM